MEALFPSTPIKVVVEAVFPREDLLLVDIFVLLFVDFFFGTGFWIVGVVPRLSASFMVSIFLSFGKCFLLVS